MRMLSGATVQRVQYGPHATCHATTAESANRHVRPTAPFVSRPRAQLNTDTACITATTSQVDAPTQLNAHGHLILPHGIMPRGRA